MAEGWIALTRTATLKTGETRRVSLNSKHYVTWKDHKQRVQLAPDACKHRGASLSMGKVINEGVRSGCLEWYVFSHHADRKPDAATSQPIPRMEIQW